jgi:hypothetical protein
MKQFVFHTLLTSDATIKIPSDVAVQIEHDQPIRVVLLVSEPSVDDEWSRLTADQFLQGYGDSDAVYDQLSSG